ncbi:hypothetical protein K2X30_08125 [bacterium]|nr:hypothetical protein [bacterium]
MGVERIRRVAQATLLSLILPACTLQLINSRKLSTTTSTSTSVFSWNYVGQPNFKTLQYGTNSLAVDSTGKLYFAFSDAAASTGYASVYTSDGTEWTPLGIAGFSGGVASQVVIKIDSSDVPYVGFVNLSDSQKTSVMKWNGTNWVLVGSASFSAGAASNITLTIDSTGAPVLGYTDILNGSKGTVMRFDGTNWVALGGSRLYHFQYFLRHETDSRSFWRTLFWVQRLHGRIGHALERNHLELRGVGKFLWRPHLL